MSFEADLAFLSGVERQEFLPNVVDRFGGLPAPLEDFADQIDCVESRQRQTRLGAGT